DSPDEDSATHARLLGTAVHSEFTLVTAFRAGAANIIANARPATFDGPAQHLGDGDAQPVGFEADSLPSLLRRSQAGLEERLVGVDIPHSSHDALIKQYRFQTARGAMESCAPVAA